MDIETYPDDLEDVSEKSRTINQPLVKIKPLKQKKLKRKAHTKINRELHPFKAIRLNRGDKRKNTFYETPYKKIRKPLIIFLEQLMKGIRSGMSSYISIFDIYVLA